MAVGRFQDYQPIGPGAYEFRLDDGSPFVATGPEADQLARALDASRPPMLAMNGAGGREDAGMGMSVPDVAAPMMSAAPPPPPGPTVQAYQETPSPPATTAQPSATPPPAAGGAGGFQGSGDVQNYLFRPVVSAGSPGVSQTQLQKRATQGVAMPTGSQETVEGGFAPNEAYLEGMATLSGRRRELNNWATTQAIQAAEQGQADAGAEFARQGAKFQEQEQIARTVESRVREDEGRYLQLREQYRSAKVDPQRLFKASDGSTNVAAVLGSALAQGLGAFGAGLTGGPNFAQQIIDSAIERDISAQEQDVSILGESANNALGDFMRQTGNLDQAKAMLRQVEHDWVSAQRAQIAAAAKIPEIEAKAKEWDMAEQERMMTFFEDYRRASLGKHVQSVASQMAYPVAPTRGGMRAPTEKEIQQRAGTLNTVQGLEKGQADIAKTRAETAQTQAEVAAGPKVEGAGDFNKARASMDSALETGVSLARKYGFEVDPQTGDLKPTGNASFPSRGVGLVPGIPNSADHQSLAGDLAAFGAMYARAANGGTSEPTPAMIEALTPDPTATDEAIRQRIENGVKHLILLRKNIDASAPQQLREQRAERKQEVNMEAAGVRPSGQPTVPAAQRPAPSKF